MSKEAALLQTDLAKRLRPFEVRVRWVLAWRNLALAGVGGSALAFLADLGDWRGYWHAGPGLLIVPIVVAFLGGITYALLRPLPAEVLAQLIDHRAALKDRVTTALLCRDHPFADPLREDALSQLEALRPSQLFRFRFAVPHAVLLAALLMLLILRFLPLLPLPFFKSLRNDRRQAKQMVEEVRRVLVPVVGHAKKPEATKLERSIAQQVEDLHRRSQYGRLSKKQALVKLNKLLADADRLEQQQQQQMQSISKKAITASESLKSSLTQKALASKMPELESLLKRRQELQKQLESGRNANGKPLSEGERQALQQQLQTLQQTMNAMGQQGAASQQQMQSLQQQQSQLQQSLQSGRNANGKPLTESERKALEKQLESINQQMRALQLSKQAQEFMRKLMNDPNYQKAMALLQKLQDKMAKSGQPQSGQPSQQDLAKMQKELEQALEQMAKRYGSDAEIKKLAEEMLEAAKRAKELKECSSCPGGPGHKGHAGFG